MYSYSFVVEKLTRLHSTPLVFYDHEYKEIHRMSWDLEVHKIRWHAPWELKGTFLSITEKSKSMFWHANLELINFLKPKFFNSQIPMFIWKNIGFLYTLC